MRERYWKWMADRKFSLLYMDFYHGKSVRIDRSYDIILAVISTGALGGLFITESLQFVMAGILVVAQIVSAARPFLPYCKRIERLGKGIYILTQQYNVIESYWHSVDNGQLSDEQINEIYYDLKNKWDKTLQEVLCGDDLPVRKNCIKLAQKECNTYFKSLFGVTEGK